MRSPRKSSNPVSKRTRDTIAYRKNPCHQTSILCKNRTIGADNNIDNTTEMSRKVRKSKFILKMRIWWMLDYENIWIQWKWTDIVKERQEKNSLRNLASDLSTHHLPTCQRLELLVKLRTNNSLGSNVESLHHEIHRPQVIIDQIFNASKVQQDEAQKTVLQRTDKFVETQTNQFYIKHNSSRSRQLTTDVGTSVKAFHCLHQITKRESSTCKCFGQTLWEPTMMCTPWRFQLSEYRIQLCLWLYLWVIV